MVKANGTHSLTITLIDQDADSKDYNMVVTFFKKPPTVEVKIHNVTVIKEEIVRESDLYGRINMMD